jgi:hypothetical protein
MQVAQYRVRVCRNKSFAAIANATASALSIAALLNPDAGCA